MVQLLLDLGSGYIKVVGVSDGADCIGAFGEGED